MRWIPDKALDRLRGDGSAPDLSETRYRLIDPIGRGGMGTVYLVEDPALGRRVALKLLDAPDEAGELTARLVREAQIRIARSAHKSPGAAQLANYFVGQIVGSLDHVKSVRSVVEELVQGYADTMERLDDWAQQSD